MSLLLSLTLLTLVVWVNGEKYATVKELEDMLSAMNRLASQVQMQQFYKEEESRAMGHSGVKGMRLRGEGTRPYHSTGHSDDFTMAAMHDHPEFVDTVGMGEIIAVLNGIEFKTRHNDYRFLRKSLTSSQYGDTDPMPLPDVPQSVLNKVTVADQILEMREYFRAWRDQDDTIRDYKPYFKANLCYLEGAWTDASMDTLQEPFASDRHWMDADSWADLFQKTRFSSYSGTKDNLENYGFMPSTLWKVNANGSYVYGQWNYKILCHPIDRDFPLNRLRAVDDLKTRMSTGMTFDEYVATRNARFQVNPSDSDEWCDGPSKHGLLDDLMEDVPGFDNYQGDLIDDAFGNTIRQFNEPPGSTALANTAYYHRWFQNEDSGAMGVKIRHRGLLDEHMWSAMNTQSNMLAIDVEKCHFDDGENVCASWSQRWSYAIPMEIIYSTPLHKWNPYNIEYKGSDKVLPGKTVTADGRDGSNSVDKAFNGIHSSKFYQTPASFFSGLEIGDDPADTPQDWVYVLDQDANVRQVRASGIRTVMPEIPGLGVLRQRYPIHPVYGEGMGVWKELAALSDINMEPNKYGFMVRNEGGEACSSLKLILTGNSHSHEVILPCCDLAPLNAGATVTVWTSVANGHSHLLVIKKTGDSYAYLTCGGAPMCLDGHPNDLSIPMWG